jgi:prefoldin subunit 5
MNIIEKIDKYLLGESLESAMERLKKLKDKLAHWDDKAHGEDNAKLKNHLKSTISDVQKDIASLRKTGKSGGHAADASAIRSKRGGHYYGVGSHGDIKKY